jgi:predicted nucleic acid-binding protein
MGYLLDTNCWMQVVRNREHVLEVRDLLAALPGDLVHVTDFAVHSIAVAMRRHGMLDQLPTFIAQSRIGQDVRLVRLEMRELTRVVQISRAYNLDFDDAFQYTAAELNGLRLVSLDVDFDRTPRGRLTPAAALKHFLDDEQQRAENP